MKQGKGLPRRFQKIAAVVVLWCAAGIASWGQQVVAEPITPPPSVQMADAIRELQEQVRELRAAVSEVRSEAAQYRAETSELRRELQSTREQLASSQGPAGMQPSSGAASVTPPHPEGAQGSPESTQPASLDQRVSALEESSQLVNDKVEDQYQSKVESASKYHLRLSGVILFNLFNNRGSTDNQDFPSWVVQPNPLSPNGDFGATLRQSEIGLDVFGPRLAGARTSGSVQLDFAGGFPNDINGINLGVVRLRTASMRLDWEKTSIVAGQDPLFISPLSPTSFATLAIPSLSYTGNLWGWIPQVRVEHRFDLSGNQNLTVQGGIIDNVVGDPPYSLSERIPQPGERSSQPGYATRVAWTRQLFGQPLTLGMAGYYGRQDWAFNRHINGWAGMTDWQLPLSSRVSLSGEFYRGYAIGGFGGGIGRSVLFDRNPIDPAGAVHGLASVGGWSQLKFRATPKLEFNAAAGVDNPFSADLRAFTVGQSYIDPRLSQNRAALANFVYRPRSNLLFSAEYRHLTTFQIDNDSYSADQVNLIMGILF